MWKSLAVCFNGVIDDEIVEVRKPKDLKAPNHIYRDEVVNEKDLSTANHAKNTNGIFMSLSGDQREIPGPSQPRELEGVVRVKIVLTKQEAAKLMSKCKGEGGVLKDVLRELRRIEISRASVSVVPTTAFRNSWRPTLKSIPEER